jgi:cob(I)alamin adenosyltransferase
MSRMDEYLTNAEECERMAEISPNSSEKAAWLHMAQQWLRWAKQRPIDPSRAGEVLDRR